MRASLLGGDMLEVGRGPAPKRPSRGRQHQLGDLVGSAAAQALGQRGVFGVDRHDLTGPRRPQHQRTTGDQRFLVGQRQPGTCLERGQRRSQAQRADQRIEDDVGLGLLDQPGGGVGSVVGDVADPLRRVLVSDGNIGHPGLRTLSQQRVQMGAASGQPDYLETVRIVGDDLKRLGADRAGTAQHHHPQPAVSAPVGRVGHLIIVRHHLVVTAPPDHDASTGSHTSPWNAIVLMPALDAKMPCVRTTIRIDDELYREVKAKAARSGRTVAAVLEDAVRRGLNPPKPQAAGRYRVQPSGKGGLRPGVDLSSNAALAEAMNDGVSVDAVR